MKSILNIAEKPSIAREISKILGKPPKLIPTLSQFNPVYEFDLPDINGLMKFTSVRGHDMTDWSSYDPRILFTQKVISVVGFGNQKLVQNIEFQSADAQQLILWLDCDLEGQAIAKQVQQLCLKINPHLLVKRARFSSLAPRQIWYAIKHLQTIKQADVKAVKYRQQLDFRIGCAMTNIQTLLLKRQKAQSGRPINYGTCLIPLVNLVVERFIERRNFQSVSSWKINVLYQDSNNKIKCWFNWNEQNNFSLKQNAYSDAQNIKFATIVGIQKEKVFRKRPLPLDTSTLLKHCTRHLRIQSLKVMEIAEKLYQQRYISYPRTQTNKYPGGLNLLEIVKKFENDDRFKDMVSVVMKGQKVFGRSGGDNDNAHAPIYPLQVKTTFQGGVYEEAIYQFIVTNFLASVAQDAEIQEHRLFIKTNNGYQFTTKGSKVIERGFLDILKISVKQQNMPNFVEGQNILISRTKVIQQQTQPPPELSEANLIQLMQDNKIGTDATIPEHISNIQLKGFAQKISNQFMPTKLGVALIQSYYYINSKLNNSKLRAEMQSNVKKICSDESLYQQTYNDTIKQFIEAYDHLMQNKSEFTQMFSKFIDLEIIKKQEKQIEELVCHSCQTNLTLQKRSLVCKGCNLRYFLPKEGKITLLTGTQCLKCKSALLSINKNNFEYKICPRCFNYPQPHMQQQVVEQGAKLPCFACKLTDCIHSGNFSFCKCEKCNGNLRLVKPKNFNTFIGCSNYPNCNTFISFSSYVANAEPSQNDCPSCSTQDQKVKMCKLVVGPKAKQTQVCIKPSCKVKRNYIKSIK